MSDSTTPPVSGQPQVNHLGLPPATEEEMKAVLEVVNFANKKLGKSLGAQGAFFSHPDIGTLAVRWLAEIVNQCLAQTIYADRHNFLLALHEASQQQTIRNKLIPGSVQLHAPTVSALIRGGQNIVQLVPVPQLDLTAERRDQQSIPTEPVSESTQPKSNILIP